jgi:hypothetical protein
MFPGDILKQNFVILHIVHFLGITKETPDHIPEHLIVVGYCPTYISVLCFPARIALRAELLRGCGKMQGC